MKLSELFHRNYLNSGDVTQGGIHTVIVGIDVEDVVGDEKPGDFKPVMRVQGFDKGIVINRTNGDALMQAFGDDTDAMIGKEIKLSRGRTLYKGKMVDCVTITPIMPTVSESDVRQAMTPQQQPASPFRPAG